MKRALLLILIFLPIMAISANAQTLIAEKDWTDGFEGNYPYSYAFLGGVEGSISSDADGVAITVGSQTGQTWPMWPLVHVFPDEYLHLNQNGNYKIVITAKFPTNGTLMVVLGNGSDRSASTYVTATGDFQEVEINNPSIPEVFDANLTLYCGDFVGTTILKKIQLFEMDKAIDEVNGIRYFFDKNRKTAEVEKVLDIQSTKIDIPTTVIHENEEYTVTKIMDNALSGLYNLTSVTIPNSVTIIGQNAFYGCYNLEEITIPASMNFICPCAFAECGRLKRVIALAETPPVLYENAFSDYNMTLKVPDVSIDVYKATAPWKNFKEIVALPAQYDYRPFVEEGKVWKVGDLTSGNTVQLVDYYYFDGETAIDGKTCKQMMRQRYVSPDFPEYDYYSQQPSLDYVGAWYEEDKKVYVYDTVNKQFTMMYDFGLDDNGIFLFNNLQYVVGSKQIEGIKGFKGVYRDIRLLGNGESIYSVPWLEGVGGTDGPTINVYPGYVNPRWFLMSCTVGDEVIYLNDEYEDGASPSMGARKRRIDFTHTIKIQPKARTRNGAEESMYGEYNDQQLCINIDPLDDTYLVCITDEFGKTVYEKNIYAGNIVGLNIDISAYTEGCYTVTVENSHETFTGEFEAQTTGIKDVRNKRSDVKNNIYNLQGQRLSIPPAKGFYIQNGKKMVVK